MGSTGAFSEALAAVQRLLGRRSAEDTRRPGLALALSGGGARGLAHIGVLKVLEANDVRVDAVAGTSMGALIAIAAAARTPAGEIEAIARRIRVTDVLRVDHSGMGLASAQRLGELIVEAVGQTLLEELALPCLVVATDLTQGTRHVFDKGPIAQAVRATIAIPGLFSPEVVDRHLLVDGGILEPLPVESALAFGAKHVLAVDVSAARNRPLVAEPSLGLVPRRVASPMFLLRLLGREQAVDVVVKAFEVQSAELAGLLIERAKPDVVIRPAVGEIRMDQFDSLDEAVAAGEAAAQAALPAILALAQPRRAP